MGNAIERAKIYEIDVKDNKTQITPPIDVCFNPKEYSIEKALSWDSSKAFSDAPIPEFKSPTAMTLSVTLQFDTYEERISVRDKYIRKLEKLTLMKSPATSEKDVKKHSPPLVLWVWGKMKFKGVIESLSQKYTMFLSDGTPVRCECALKIRNVLDLNIDPGQKDITAKQSSQRTYTVQDGDRLDLIAATQLGDPSRWSEIAALNGLDNPTADLTSGSTLQLPE